MKALVSMCLVGVMTVGCGTPRGSARYVEKDSARGILALPANNDLNQEKAKELMAMHFPDGYIVEREWEHEVGEDTTFSESSHDRIRQIAARNGDDKTKPDLPLSFGQHGQSSGIQSTRKANEWRISYIRVKESKTSDIELSGHNEPNDASESVVAGQQQVAPGQFKSDVAQPKPAAADASPEANPFEDPSLFGGRPLFQKTGESTSPF